jgi:hypothetical protein
VDCVLHDRFAKGVKLAEFEDLFTGSHGRCAVGILQAGRGGADRQLQTFLVTAFIVQPQKHTGTEGVTGLTVSTKQLVVTYFVGGYVDPPLRCMKSKVH